MRSRLLRGRHEKLLAGWGRRDRDRATAFVRRFRRILFEVALAAAGDRAAAGDVARPASRKARPHASLPDSRRGTVRARPSAMSARGAMTCSQMHDVVAELALGALTGRERAAALDHLDRCRACREDVHRLMVVGGLLLELIPPARPPTGFEDRMIERLNGDLNRR
jgi:hypothetical protein